jgi:hypothetical protein
MVFITSAKTVFRVLIAVVLFLTLAGLGAKGLRWIWNGDGLASFLSLFYAGEEASIPTWYQSFTLLLSAGLLAIIAVATRKQGGQYARHWLGLSIIFWFLSMDEVIQVHERLGRPNSGVEPILSNYLGLTPSGWTYHIWAVPGAAFALIFVLAFLRFLVRLPKETRRLFLVAGTIYVLGALGFETLGGKFVSEFGGFGNWGNVGAIPKIIAYTLTSIEEFLEMLGVAVFVYALLSYITSYMNMRELTIGFRLDDETAKARGWDPGKTRPTRYDG